MIEDTRADLVARFPEERTAIERYFRDLKRASACVLGAAMGGVAAAGAALGSMGFPRVMTAIMASRGRWRS